MAAKKGLGLQADPEHAQWLEGIREPGEAADGTLKGNEAEVLVFEDALVRTQPQAV